jgi:FkbM family methyltransferase
MFYSQSEQDKWVAEFFNYKKNGYFIEVGAYDGIQTSNTYFLEKELEWTGICIEADPTIFYELYKNRKTKNINIAVSNFNGYCPFDKAKLAISDIQNNNKMIPCSTLNEILLKNNADKHIDYLSLDIEGSEYDALESLDFNYWNIVLITVEHNLYCTNSDQKNKIYNILSSNNFIRAKEDVVCLDKNPLFYNKPYEDWYINKNYIEKGISE